MRRNRDIRLRIADGGSRIGSRGPRRVGAPASHPPCAIRRPPLVRSGFNLVEALVATMILSSSVLTLGAIGTNALSNTRLHRHYETAASLIDRQLSLIDYLGIDAFLEAGQTEGVVEEFDPGYQWSVTAEYQGIDNLYLVTITMTWLEGKRPQSVTAQTMLDGTGAALGTSTGPETGGGQQTP